MKNNFATVALILLSAPTVAAAQFSLFGSTDDLAIVAEPSNPEPNSTVVLSVESVLLDLDSADIAWTVNGKLVEAPDVPNRITVETGAAGTKLTATAKVTTSDGKFEKTLTITPAAVDLIIDAVSYVPPFYKGRPLASPGTTMRLLAIPHFADSNGVSLSNEAMLFTWRQNGSVVASGRGKAAVTLPAPGLFGSDTLSVEAKSLDGFHAGSASVQLPGIDPQATLYVSHPLYGIEYFDAIDSQASVADVEMTFVAVPYFAEAMSPNDARLVYEWSVNGRAVPGAGTNASEITINSDNSSGVAALSLDLTSSSNFYLHATQSWNVRFPGGMLGGGTIPGTTPQSSTIFHTGVQ
ncbi:MAG TPA: hypothetical protein VI483_00820 [Candidatus Paceibacterota bacterium]